MQRDFIQNNIFDITEFQTPEEIARANRKRGNYKAKKKFKPIKLNPYTEMNNLYISLANYLPLPLFSNDEGVFVFGKIRYWYMVYNSDEYSYLNDDGILEDCQGDDFKVVEAEIIGTENMSIDKRIALHKALIELLRNGIQLEKAVAEVMNGK